MCIRNSYISCIKHIDFPCKRKKAIVVIISLLPSNTIILIEDNNLLYYNDHGIGILGHNTNGRNLYRFCRDSKRQITRAFIRFKC